MFSVRSIEVPRIKSVIIGRNYRKAEDSSWGKYNLFTMISRRSVEIHHRLTGLALSWWRRYFSDWSILDVFFTLLLSLTGRIVNEDRMNSTPYFDNELVINNFYPNPADNLFLIEVLFWIGYLTFISFSPWFFLQHVLQNASILLESINFPLKSRDTQISSWFNYRSV